jgi:SAM-dependent methyltransferase
MNLLHLLQPNREAWESWKGMLQSNAKFRQVWTHSEWVATGNLLHTAVTRFLGRYIEDGHRPCRFLDIGFGLGYSFEFLRRELHVAESDMTGVEILPEHVARCREQYPGARIVQIKDTVEALVEWLKIERESVGWYDLILARNVLQFIPEPQRVLAGISGLLPEGSVFVLTIPKRGPSLWNQERVTDFEMGFSDPGLHRAAKRLDRLPVTVAATTPVHSARRTWTGGWSGLLRGAGLDPVEMGQRQNLAERRGKDMYAFCRRVP